MISNEELLEEFLNDMKKERQIGEKRVEKYRLYLRVIFRVLGKPFIELTDSDITSFILEIDKRDYSDWTRRDYRIILKVFGKWVNKKYNKNLDFDSIKTTLKQKMRLPETLLNDNEIESIIDCCSSARDKSFFAVLWDSGCRLAELLNLKIMNVRFDKYGAIIVVNGKTGARRIRLIDSSSLLYEYLQSHDKRDNPESHVWYSTFDKRSKEKANRPMTHGAIYKILRELCKKAGIKKRVYPHLFRHTRATFYANKLTEAQMKEHFGWVQNSDMASVYVHLSGRDVDNGILKAHGIVEEEDSPKTLFLSRYTKKDEAVENLVLDFLKIIAEENPKITERFRQLVKEKNMEGAFE